MKDYGRDEYEFVTCEAPNCDKKFKNHKWGHIKAEDWFQQKNGMVWCPKHIPDWVAGWRKKQSKKP